MNPCAALGSLDSHACDEASPTSPAPHPRGPRGVSRRLVPAPSRCCAGPRETETQRLVRVGAERGLQDRGGFLEEDAFGQGRAGSGERRGRSRAAGATGWLLPRRGGVEVRDRDGGAWPGRRGNRSRGPSPWKEISCFAAREVVEKQPKALAFGPDTVMSGGQDRALAFLGCQPSARPAASATGVCPSPAWRLEIPGQSRAGPPQASLLGVPMAVSSPRPHRVAPCVCVPTSSSYRGPQSCGIRAQPSDPITLFTSVKVTSPNSCILAAGGQDSSTGLCRRRSACSGGGGRGDVRAPAPPAQTLSLEGVPREPQAATMPWGPPPCNPPALFSPEGRTPRLAAWLAVAEPPRPLVPGTSRPC